MAEPTEEDMTFAWPADTSEEPEMDVSLGSRKRPLRARGPKQQGPREPPTLPIIERKKKRPARSEPISAAKSAPNVESVQRAIVAELDRRTAQSERLMRHLAEQTAAVAKRLDEVDRELGTGLDRIGKAVSRIRRPVVTAEASTAVEDLHALVDEQLLTHVTEQTGALAQRLDEVERGIGSRLNRLDRAVSSVRRATVTDDTASPAVEKLHAAVDQLRDDVVSATTGIESRLSAEAHGRHQQLKEALDRYEKSTRRIVTRDDLKQLWVEVAAMVAQERSHVSSELERFSRELSERLDRFTRRGLARTEPNREVEERLAVLLDTVELALRTAETTRQEIVDGVVATMQEELRKRAVTPLPTGLSLPPGLQGVPGD